MSAPDLWWYRCHGCGFEAWTKDGVRNWRSCPNTACPTPDIHVHSNRDGELPQTLEIPA